VAAAVALLLLPGHSPAALLCMQLRYSLAQQHDADDEGTCYSAFSHIKSVTLFLATCDDWWHACLWLWSTSSGGHKDFLLS
jgi:hypothetical protein